MEYRLQSMYTPWYKFYYFKNIKINNGCCFPIVVFRVLGSPSSPPRGKGPGAPRIPKWKKLEYCNTIKIILYNFVIIFYKNLFKIKK